MSTSARRIAVVIPAGGSGERMGGVTKPLLQLGGVPLLRRAVQPFLDRADVHWVIVALPADLAARPPEWLMSHTRVDVVAGGSHRGESVRRALSVVPMEADLVLVHDGVRPLVTAAVIERCVAAAADGESAIAAIPVVDTIKAVDDAGHIVDTPDRSVLWAAQTPQAFPAEVLRNAHARGAADAIATTDDAALVARYGGIVKVVMGAPENVKITTQYDLAVAEALLARSL